jgi:putative transcription antitermination factor YqgF
MRILALDIGLRRTGVAFADAAHGIPLPLATLRHASFQGLAEQVRSLVEARHITHIVVGLPLLPSGDVGEQVTLVRQAMAEFSLPSTVTIDELDERFTTLKGAGITDPDAEAACQILTTYLARQSI